MNEDIEAREKAAPLTAGVYAVWKSNIEAIAEAHAGPWYRREGERFVPVPGEPGDEITTTVGIQLRLFATIDALLVQLKDREEKLEAEKEWREAKHTCPVDYCCWSAALAGRDRILKGSE